MIREARRRGRGKKISAVKSRNALTQKSREIIVVCSAGESIKNHDPYPGLERKLRDLFVVAEAQNGAGFPNRELGKKLGDISTVGNVENVTKSPSRELAEKLRDLILANAENGTVLPQRELEGKLRDLFVAADAENGTESPQRELEDKLRNLFVASDAVNGTVFSENLQKNRELYSLWKMLRTA